jgi:hypothetical protein
MTLKFPLTMICVKPSAPMPGRLIHYLSVLHDEPQHFFFLTWDAAFLIHFMPVTLCVPMHSTMNLLLGIIINDGEFTMHLKLANRSSLTPIQLPSNI